MPILSEHETKHVYLLKGSIIEYDSLGEAIDSMFYFNKYGIYTIEDLINRIKKHIVVREKITNLTDVSWEKFEDIPNEKKKSILQRLCLKRS